MRVLEKPNIVDVEASGFGGMSYPIEIGIALENDTQYCSLISPAPDWEHWDSEAEKIHRIARDILEAHGGKIWVETIQGTSTRFCFTLPRAE